MAGFIIGGGDITYPVTLHGEADEIDLQVAEQEVEKLRIKLADYHPESIDEMCSKLRTLAFGNRSVHYMVDALGLDAITKAARQKLHDKVVEMLTMWFQLKEKEYIDSDDEGENCAEL